MLLTGYLLTLYQPLMLGVNGLHISLQPVTKR